MAYSQEVAQELYPVAVKQARSRFLLVAGLTALLTVFAVASINDHFQTSGRMELRSVVWWAGGLIWTVVAWRRWRRLKGLTPMQAADKNLL